MRRLEGNDKVDRCPSVQYFLAVILLPKTVKPHEGDDESALGEVEDQQVSGKVGSKRRLTADNPRLPARRSPRMISIFCDFELKRSSVEKVACPMLVGADGRNLEIALLTANWLQYGGRRGDSLVKVFLGKLAF